MPDHPPMFMPVTLALEGYQVLNALGTFTQVFFAFAFGACLGSLINVLAYRMPRGLGVVTPPSACPSCSTRLTWRENIPVLGWLLLRGRCRFCQVRISPEYPIVEAIVGGLFAATYTLWYLLPRSTVFDRAGGGINWTMIGPDWAYIAGPAQTWPYLVVVLILLASLVAMTIIDARTFTIPLVLAWVPTALALVAHPLHAWVVQRSTETGYRTRHQADIGWEWIIPTPDRDGWGWVGAALGGVLGVAAAMALLHFKLIRRSYADYEQWEAQAKAEAAAAGQTDESGSPATMWVQYPHARREAMKEVVFLAPVVALGMAGWWLARAWAGPWTLDGNFVEHPVRAAPLWLLALSGVLLGYLIGGGLVWAIRILGSLAFGKEAMGLGDVHLLAAVGACVGWINAVMAFFVAAFVGLAWTILGRVFSGKLQKVMPYGPYLSVATVLVLVAKPAIEWAITRVTGAFPPFRLP